MKVHEFTVIPLEVGQASIRNIRDSLDKSQASSESKDLWQLEDAYLWKDASVTDQYGASTFLVCVIDTSLCFVLYGEVEVSESDAVEDVASGIKCRRKLIEEGVECPSSDHLNLKKVYDELGPRNGWNQKYPTYAFSFYVLEPAETAEEVRQRLQEEGGYLYQLVHALVYSRSKDSDVAASEAISRQVVGEPKTSNLLPYLDPYRNIAGLATWSSFAFVAHSQELEVATSTTLSAEITLQVVWNRCNFLSEAFGQEPSSLPTDFQVSDQLRAVLAAKQISKRALSATVSSRRRRLMDYLLETSRVEDEIDSLSLVTDSLKNRVEQKREHRREVGQGVITTMLALFAGVGVVDALSDSWGRPLLHGIVGIVVAVFTAYFSLWRPRKRWLRR